MNSNTQKKTICRKKSNCLMQKKKWISRCLNFERFCQRKWDMVDVITPFNWLKKNILGFIVESEIKKYHAIIIVFGIYNLNKNDYILRMGKNWSRNKRTSHNSTNEVKDRVLKWRAASDQRPRGREKARRRRCC